MDKNVERAVFLISILAILVWSVDRFLLPILPSSINNNIFIFVALIVTLIGVLGGFKDTIELIHLLFNHESEQKGNKEIFQIEVVKNHQLPYRDNLILVTEFSFSNQLPTDVFIQYVEFIILFTKIKFYGFASESFALRLIPNVAYLMTRTQGLKFYDFIEDINKYSQGAVRTLVRDRQTEKILQLGAKNLFRVKSESDLYLWQGLIRLPRIILLTAERHNFILFSVGVKIRLHDDSEIEDSSSWFQHLLDPNSREAKELLEVLDMR